MNGLYDLLQSPVAEQLAWTLLHSLWQLAAIGLATWYALRLMRRRSANARYAVACAALTTMLAAPLITFDYLQFGPVPIAPAFNEAASDAQAPPASSGLLAPEPSLTKTAEATTPASVTTPHRPTMVPYLTALWGLGVVFGSLRLIGGWAMIQRLRVSGTQPMPGDWPERVTSLVGSMGLSRRVRVLASSKAALPVALGVWRPLVLIPVAVLNELSPAQVESIITHELAHVRRHDYLTNLAQCVAETLLFYHPAVWWVGRAIRQEREHCCDDRVVACHDNRANYAMALTRLAELLNRQPQVAPAATGGTLSQRIRRIMQGEPTPQDRRAERWLLAGLLPVLLTVGLIVYGVQADTPPDEATPIKTEPTAAETPPTIPAGKPVFTQRIIAVPKDRLLDGDASVNIVIRSGDVIRISKAGGNVYLGGKVKRPGSYALPGDRPLTVKQLVTLAGGMTPEGDGVIVTRRFGDTDGLVFAATDQELNQIGSADLELEPNDLVKVVYGIRNQAKGDRAKQLRKAFDDTFPLDDALRDRESKLRIELEQAQTKFDEKHKLIQDIETRLAALKAERKKLKSKKMEAWDALMEELRKQVVKPKPANKATAIRPGDLKPTTTPYQFVPGDLVSVSVHELINPGVEHAQTRRIDEQGRIRLTVIGEIKAAGLTAKALEQQVVKALHPNTIRDPKVSVTVQEARGNTFSVIGDSKDVRTGVYTLTRPDMRLLEAIALVGGVPQDARVFVIRQENAKDEQAKNGGSE